MPSVDDTAAKIGSIDDLALLQRRAILGSLSAIIAHEYNNLMTPVFARAQDALMRNDVAAMRKALSTTVRQTELALRVTREIIDLAANGSPESEPCQLLGLINKAISSAVRPFEKDGIEIVLDVPADLQINAQPHLFQQVVLNLLLNARHAMDGRSGTIRITATPEGGVHVIEVCDSGAGLSEQGLAETNAFLSADDTRNPGSWKPDAFGLHTCRLIAKRHGASISARENPGAGTTFQIRWPAV